ncbi:MAG: mannose-1-phosphate guanylyltransferase/mannose-6-phosphate isomerase [Pseudomonadota bacterium]
MKDLKVLPVILSGGIGSRLWPLSRSSHPKPFIKLNDDESFIQKTYRRAHNLATDNEVVIVTNRDLFFYTKDEFEQLALASYKTFLLEPCGRSSTAAIALAAHYAKNKYGDNCALLVMPTDHLINDFDAFAQAVKQAVELTRQSKLVTFGIKPDEPKTEFGYIEANGNEVKKFVEKPDLTTAKHYLGLGNFFWNSGMFCMQAGKFIDELTKHNNTINKHSQLSFNNAKHSQASNWQQFEINYTDFEQIEDIAVDYAVFEKSKDVAIVPCDIGWSDVGSWKEFGSLYPADDNNNNITGNVITQDTADSIVYAGDKLVATLGVSDLVIADTTDALLVTHKNRSQDVRKIVNQLKLDNNSSVKQFPTVHRPWGSYTIIMEGYGFKIKCIKVKPGGGISLQSHHHRSEHWVVVNGVATVTNADEIISLKHNESTFIPIGAKHRLENQAQDILTVIEVQCGQYLGEDDIIRYNDVYGRTA